MGKVLERQGYHLAAYLLLGAALYAATSPFPSTQNRMWGLSAREWIAASWILAGLSQAWVLLFWRLELYHGRISGSMGRVGFLVHRIGYVALFALRFFPLIPISRATANTMHIPPVVNLPLILITTPLILWALASALFYFGLNRLSGADHFDPSYRGGALEKRGIYKYVPNAAYSVGILFSFHPGLFWQSPQGLITAAAHFAFVWVHYFCTEKLDMEEIYGRTEGSGPSGTAAERASTDRPGRL